MLSKRQRWGLSIAGFLVFVWFIEIYIGWARLLAPWRSVDLRLLCLALSMVLASYAMRAYRLYAYFRASMQGAFSLALKLMLQHNLANNFLPMRMGELSFPMLMSRYFRIPLARSMPALLWFRAFDLHTLMLLAIWALGSQWLGSGWLLWGLLIWLTIPWFMFRFNHWWLDKLRGRETGRLVGYLVKLLEGAPNDLGLLLRVWLWTLLNWLVKLIAFAWLLALFAQLSAAPALLGVIGGELTSVLPVHGVAGAGTYEAGIVAALIPAGVPAEVALAAAVNVHLFLLGATLLGALLSLAIRSRRVP
jgi:uncharacterized membrane protein YbhN (UPF0104 family)